MPLRSGRMHKTARLPESLRDQLGAPHGTLVKGKEVEVSQKVSELIKKSKPSKVITVGDIVTRSMLSVGVKPDLSIVDGKTLRGPEAGIDYAADITHSLVNPPGLITADAWRVIEKALKENGKIRIIVDGEEDLLGIPVALLAPTGSLMLYGQPNEGIVMVTIDNEIRRFAKSILNQMEEQER